MSGDGINELDIAELKHEMRSMYKNIGYDGSIRCLHEILVSARILSEIILEEMKNDNV